MDAPNIYHVTSEMVDLPGCFTRQMSPKVKKKFKKKKKELKKLKAVDSSNIK